MQELDPREELDSAVKRVLASKSAKRLIVAGPGAGKTSLFRRLLESTSGDENDRIALTFINELKDDLEKNLGELAKVYTLHGYCHYLLRQQPRLRQGLSDVFKYFPGLEDLIIRDWKLTAKKDTPKFIGLMRDLSGGSEVDFYRGRSDYYDAVSYDDSVYRAYIHLREGLGSLAAYKLILVDEYQDFNRLESSIIELLADKSPIVIAGDDDQALYSQLRSSSQEFIRKLHLGSTYEVFKLPFCMRCPKAVVLAVNAILVNAEKRGFLQGRIQKPFKYFAPVKETDSKKYPYIQIAECSTQTLRANYFGRYIAQEIHKIPADEIAKSHDEDYPTVLIIGSTQYLQQIHDYLTEQGFSVIWKADSQSKLSRERGICILKKNPESNLGWRIIVESDHPTFEEKVVKDSVDTAAPMHAILPEEFKVGILQEAAAFEVPIDSVPAQPPETDKSKPIIKLTSFEGSKGLSAQHVFVVGVHENELPKNAAAIRDLEISKFLVSLTRTRKQCHILTAFRFGATSKRPSIFLTWIPAAIRRVQKVNKAYWATAS